MVKQGLSGLPGLWSLRETIDDQGKMHHKQVKAAIDRICDTVFAVKAGQSRLRHDRAIQGGNGVLPRAAGAEAVCRGYVNVSFDARTKWICRI
jgi:hypothetical protein